MGLLGLKRLITLHGEQKRKRHRHIQASVPNSSILVPKEDSLCQEDDRSQVPEILKFPCPNLPEDIWCHIHSLLSLRDSARCARVSRAFLHSWRCHPKVIFTEDTLGLKPNACRKRDAEAFTIRVDHILKNHLCIGVKTLKFVIFHPYYNVNTCDLNRWLQSIITPGIEEVTLSLFSMDKAKYNFLCSFLLDGRGNSIRYLHLQDCAFHPPVGFNCMSSLTELHLYEVQVTGDELACLISNSLGLEQLHLGRCSELIFLKIPFSLERLSLLIVHKCNMLQAIESKAPNLRTFIYFGDPVRLSLGEPSPVENLGIAPSKNAISISLSYILTNLPSTVPNLETLEVTSFRERVHTPMVADKFLHLKHLKIYFTAYFKGFSRAYDYLSLVSFLDASPALETFILSVKQDKMKHESVFRSASHMRQIQGHRHASLRKVMINGFCSAKSMVELTCHILENATSLESLTVDTVYSAYNNGDLSRCSVRKEDTCWPTCKAMVLEAHKAVMAVKRYIVGRVPAAVKLNVGEPCSRCHVIDQCAY